MANNLTLSVTLTGDGRQLTRTLRNAQGEVREFGGTTERESARAERALEGTGQQAQTVSGHLNQLRTVAIGVGAALTAMGVSSFANDTYQAVSSSQQLQASLKTVTGSIANASAAWNTLLGFAAETPFTLDQSVQAFIRMQSLGLKPSQEALRSYGNTAAAMGKDMMQMVEAVADATTGEFERLKEFGIRASKEGEQVSFTFQGVTTTVANSASAISQYLQEIGELQFAGAMADQMDTLSGKASNLEDTIYQFYLAIGDAGATGVFEATLANASSTVQFLTDNIDTLASGAEILAVLVGGRVAVALTTATTAMVAKTLATQADLRAEAAAAVANTRRTAAEKQTALALLSTARLEAQATQGTAAHTFALQQLSVARTRAATAAGAHTAAMNTATAATARASVAARGLSGALALVGGPLGLLVGGAGLLYLFRDELGLTVPQVDANTTAVNKLTNGLDDMSQAAAQLTLTSLVGQLAEVRAQAEVTAEAFTKVGQIEGDGGGGFLGVDVTAQTNAVRELGETSNATQQEAANLEAAIALVESRIGQLGERNREVTPTVTEIGDASETAAAKAKEMAKAASEQADAIEALRNRLVPHRRETVQLAQDQNTLNLAFAMGRITASEYLYMIGALQTAYIEAQNDADDLATSTTNALYTMEGAMEELRTNGLRRLDDGFADLWQGAIDGSLNASEIMKRVLSQTLAEMAHMAITRPITVQLATSMGLGGGGQQANMGSSGSFGINPMSFGGAGQTLGNAYRAFQGTGSTYAGTFGAELAVQTEGGLRAGFNSFANSGFGNAALGIGGGIAGGYVGTELGSSVFGKTANSNYGAMGGAAIGQALIPIPGLGAAIGGALGGFLDSAFGSGNTQPEFRYQQDGRAPSAYDFGGRESAFGSFGFEQQRLGEDGRAALDEFASGLQAADNALAKYMTDGQIAAASAALDAFTYSGLSNADLLADRLDVLLNASGMQGDLYDRMRNDYQGDDAAKRYESALNIAALEAALESVPDNVLTHVEARLANSDVAVGELTQSLSIQIQQWQTLRGQLELISPTFDSLAIGAVDVTNALVDAAGGLENLQGLYSSYYQNFFTEEERQARLQEQLTEQFAALNMELPGSRAEFRSLVESLDVTTASGRDAQLSLMGLSSSFAQMTAASQQAAASQNAAALSYSSIVGIDGAISDYNTSVSLAQDLAQRRKAQLQDEMRAVDQLSGLIDSLMLSNQSILDPMERLNEAQRQYAQLEIRAQAGDTQAAGQLQGASTAYLDAAAAVYGQSSSQYAMIFNEVTASVRSLEDQYGDSLATLGSIESIDRQLLREQQRARDTLTRTLSEQIQANEELGTLSGLLEALPSHLASALSGILGERTTPNGNTYIPGGFDAEGDPLLSGASGDIANAYRDILGRDPDDSGNAYWQSRLDSGTSIERIREEMAAQAADGYHRDGLDRVPFDDYRAVLHEGETVLNAQAAAAWRQQQRMTAPRALPMPNLPPMPFSNMGSNQATAAPAINLEPLLRKIDALTAELSQLRGERADDAERAARQRQAQLREQERARGRAKKGVKTV
ncbi:hypothetical protein AWR38_00430 [Idiomarina sp. WRN-38]|nr:hypothetical protein AUR68_00430 [Idiomarina sp. H105]OAE97907.1 hypothetical protein AWR38_00430 [Idiomarina sp. WRN-38]